MKILSITAQKPHSTGSGTYLTALVDSFAAAGYEQSVVCGIFPDDTVSFPDGVTCHPVFFSHRSQAAGEPSLLFTPCKDRKRTATGLPYPVVGMSDKMPYESTRYRDMTPAMIRQFEDAFIPAVRRAVDELEPDLIICHHLFLLTAMIRKHFPDRLIFGLSHGSDLRQMDYCPHLAEAVKPWIAGLDRILALHDEHKNRIAGLFSITEDRISVIGSGYSGKLFNRDGRIPRDVSDPVRICYAGKMSRSKGVPELLKVFRMMSANDPAPAFTAELAGGCQDEEIHRDLDMLPDNIVWHGQIPQQELAAIFRRSDIFVLPSYYEGLPLVLIEAMASGMIPVSTDLPGVRPWVEENVRNQNVIFVPMPEMADIDTPTEAGRAKFTYDLYDALLKAAADVNAASGKALPDTSGVTWDGVAARITALAK